MKLDLEFKSYMNERANNWALVSTYSQYHIHIVSMSTRLRLYPSYTRYIINQLMRIRMPFDTHRRRHHVYLQTAHPPCTSPRWSQLIAPAIWMCRACRQRHRCTTCRSIRRAHSSGELSKLRAVVPKKQNGACVTSMGKHGECGTWGGQTCGSSARLLAGGKCECDTGGGKHVGIV